jgi:hypothetical protein
LFGFGVALTAGAGSGPSPISKMPRAARLLPMIQLIGSLQRRMPGLTALLPSAAVQNFGATATALTNGEISSIRL